MVGKIIVQFPKLGMGSTLWLGFSPMKVVQKPARAKPQLADQPWLWILVGYCPLSWTIHLSLSVSSFLFLTMIPYEYCCQAYVNQQWSCCAILSSINPMSIIHHCPINYWMIISLSLPISSPCHPPSVGALTIYLPINFAEGRHGPSATLSCWPRWHVARDFGWPRGQFDQLHSLLISMNG